ncbi:MAG: PKD domain-containing protein [Candidatus Bathyarchaeota archaeon]|nr:PKD domain-containing protein [Candidatus Bathyarchaeota archaeon]
MKSAIRNILTISAVMLLVASGLAIFPSTAGYPPQASFIYWPAKPYLNQTVTFDASASSPEGFNDTIIQYAWTFGDGTPKVTETDPYITHNFTQVTTFIVTLNVTDSEGLWSTTSKPITIYPEFGPTANFTWTPAEPAYNQTVTFNASSTTLGWYAKKQRFSPIQTYRWNFGDGTGDFNTGVPIITHNFTQPNNYSVRLTVIDMDGRSNYIIKTVRVYNITLKTYDVNGDGTIDLKDVLRVANAYGSYPGHPRWDAACDFNKDNKVDLKDYMPVAVNFGKDP